jgi:hypothetical protein
VAGCSGSPSAGTETVQSRLWLLLRPADQALASLMRAAMWRATAARRVVAA